MANLLLTYFKYLLYLFCFIRILQLLQLYNYEHITITLFFFLEYYNY